MMQITRVCRDTRMMFSICVYMMTHALVVQRRLFAYIDIGGFGALGDRAIGLPPCLSLYNSVCFVHPIPSVARARWNDNSLTLSLINERMSLND